MDGVLILAHGSREKQPEQELNTVAAMVQKKVNMPLEVAYLEFSEKDIAWGLDRLAKQGVFHIRVVPYFLFNGVHMQKTIPAALAAYQESHQGIAITIAGALGTDPRLADILADRILG